MIWKSFSANVYVKFKSFGIIFLIIESSIGYVVIFTGRIWAGHNILKFDCPRIREAFAAIDRPAPEPKGTMDSLVLLTQKFGRRAGDMKV